MFNVPIIIHILSAKRIEKKIDLSLKIDYEIEPFCWILISYFQNNLYHAFLKD